VGVGTARSKLTLVGVPTLEFLPWDEVLGNIRELRREVLDVKTGKDVRCEKNKRNYAALVFDGDGMPSQFGRGIDGGLCGKY